MTKVLADRGKCIGAAMCVMVTSDVFALDDEGRVRVLDPLPRPERLDAAREAVAICPVEALALVEDAPG